eukprot:1927954-Rhodomonas_salina.1
MLFYQKFDPVDGSLACDLEAFKKFGRLDKATYKAFASIFEKVDGLRVQLREELKMGAEETDFRVLSDAAPPHVEGAYLPHPYSEDWAEHDDHCDTDVEQENDKH